MMKISENNGTEEIGLVTPTPDPYASGNNINGSDNGLLSDQHQATIWINAVL